MAAPRGTCPVCGKRVGLRHGGLIAVHRPSQVVTASMPPGDKFCTGSGERPGTRG